MSHFDGNPDDSYFLTGLKILFGVALFAGSPFFAYSVYRNLSEANQSESWPSTTVSVVESEVVLEYPSGRPRYSPKIGYTYGVEGQTYSGSLIRFNHPGFTQASAEEFCRKYSVGSKHTGYFDPENPKEAVLEKGSNWFSYLMLLIPLVTVFAGFFMTKENAEAIVEKNQRKKRPRKKPGVRRNPVQPTRKRRRAAF